MGLIPGWGTKIPHAVAKKKKKVVQYGKYNYCPFKIQGSGSTDWLGYFSQDYSGKW